MNHLKALQRQDGRWDYTITDKYGKTRPTGYCMPYEFIDPDTHDYPWMSEEQKSKIRATSEKHHSNGHATKEEAENCYKNYLFDEGVRISVMTNQKLRCEICKQFTDGIVHIGNGYEFHILCDNHQDRESIKSLLHVEDVWEGAE